jgi:hypothetical protein
MQFELETDIILTVYASTQRKRELFEHEIRRILRKNAPLYGSRIKKSDNTTDSAILKIVNPVPQFIPFSAGTNEELQSSKSQAIIHVRWQINWIP